VKGIEGGVQYRPQESLSAEGFFSMLKFETRWSLEAGNFVSFPIEKVSSNPLSNF